MQTYKLGQKQQGGKMAKSMIIIILFLLSVGCNLDSKHNDTSPFDRYQIAISSDGKVYRLDKKTGETVVIENGVYKPIQETPLSLRVNSMYTTEEGKMVRYVGRGKFVERPPLSSFEGKATHRYNPATGEIEPITRE